MLYIPVNGLVLCWYCACPPSLMFPLLVVRKIMVYEWLLLEMLASMLLQYYAFPQDDVSYDFLIHSHTSSTYLYFPFMSDYNVLWFSNTVPCLATHGMPACG